MDAQGPFDLAKSADESLPAFDGWITADLDYPNYPIAWRGTMPKTEEASQWFATCIDKFWGQMSIGAFEFRQSPSGDGYHVRLRVKFKNGNGHLRLPMPSEVIALRQALHDDEVRLVCDSRRMFKHPEYVGGFLNDAKSRMMEVSGKAERVKGSAGPWVKLR
jgi:hypothetical protein